MSQDIAVADWRNMFAAQVARYEAENPQPDCDRLFAATQAMWLGRDETANPGEAVRTHRPPCGSSTWMRTSSCPAATASTWPSVSRGRGG